MEKLKYIRLQENDGTYSANIPISADAQNIVMQNGNTLQDTIGDIDYTTDGDISTNIEGLHTSISELAAQKLNKSEIGTYIPEHVESWLNTNITPAPAQQAVAIDESLTVHGMAADAKAAGDVIEISNSLPSNQNNKLWLKETPDGEYQIPDWNDYENLSDDLDDLKSELTELNTELINNNILIDNIFSFPNNFVSRSTNGVQITRLSNNKLRLNGVATADFNIELSYHGYIVPAGVETYHKIIANANDEQGCYLQLGFFDRDNVPRQPPDRVTTYNTYVKYTYPSSAYDSREYFHVNNNATFDELELTFIASEQAGTLNEQVGTLNEQVGTLNEQVGTLNALNEQGIYENQFKFSSNYPIGFKKSANGVTFTIIANDAITLNGTATNTFNEHVAFNSFPVSSVMYYYIHSDDSSVTPNDIYLHVGYIKNGVAFGGYPLNVFNQFVEYSAEDESTSRCYVHINSGAVFNNYTIKFIAFNKQPLIFPLQEMSWLKVDDIFNAEPYTGEYDWQRPVVNYGKLFNGTLEVEAFAFFSDPHILGFGDDQRNEQRMENYLKRLQKVYNSTPCGFIVCGGDWLNNSTTKDEACYRLGYLNGIAKHLLDGCYLVNGNHDTNYQGKNDASSQNNTGRLSDATIASILYRDTNTHKAYFSFDGANSKCYVLDTGIEHNTMLEYDWEQVSWLADELTKDDPTHAIIFLHIILINTTVQTNTSNFATLIEAYNNHESITLNSEVYDFTQCTGHVDFWVGGHTHVDSNGTLGGIPYFITATNSYNSDVPIIDLVLADYGNEEIKLVRVGGTGTDRTISLA